jgi:hypothetical protein
VWEEGRSDEEGGVREEGKISWAKGFEVDVPPNCPASCLCGIMSVCSPSYWVCSPPFSVSMRLEVIVGEVVEWIEICQV